MKFQDICLYPFKLSDTFIDNFRGRQPEWGPLGYFIFKRTYARYLEDGTTEEFWQTLQRVIEGTFNIQKFHAKKHFIPWDDYQAQKNAKEMYQRMWDLKFLPSGRGLWLMGTDFMYKNGSAGLCSCAFVSTKDIDQYPDEPFVWAMEALMLGVGVGFDVRGAGKRSVVVPTETKPFVIPDSRQGWTESLRWLLKAFFKGKPMPVFDYSEIRPAGTRLKSFGGVASGPQPLIEFHETLTEIMIGYEGKAVDSTLIVDIFNLIGRCIVSGNIRRSAEVALGEYTDTKFMDLKQDVEKANAWRWASNNTIFGHEGMSEEIYRDIIRRNELNGEPGIIYLDTIRAYGRMVDPPDHRDADAMGVNPCVPGDTMVMTNEGTVRIDSLIGKSFNAVVENSIEKSSGRGAFCTGVKEVYEIRTQEGYVFKATGNHLVLTSPKCTQKKRYEEFVAVDDLLTGTKLILNNVRDNSNWEGRGTSEEGWLFGMWYGDGTIAHRSVSEETCVLSFWGKSKFTFLERAQKYIKTLGGDSRYHKQRTGTNVSSRDSISIQSKRLYERLENCGVTDRKDLINREFLMNSSSDFQKGFLRGWFDADGSVEGTQSKGVSVRLSSINLSMLKVAQIMLLNQGIVSVLYKNRKPAGLSKLPDGHGGNKMYFTKALHTLIISKDNLGVFRDKVGFFEIARKERLDTLLASYKRAPNKERFLVQVSEIISCGVEKVYDCTIPSKSMFGADGFLVHNCIEQALENYEACNLAESYPSRHSDYEDYQKTLRCALLYGKSVTLLDTPWPKTNAVMRKNRRLGISQSGIIEAMNKFGKAEMRKWCDKGYKFLREQDHILSKQLCVRESLKLTTVKPSGTNSLLVGVSPGIHYPHSEYYIRRVRVAANSPLLPPLIRAGYPVEVDVNQPNTNIVEFPVYTPNYRTGKRDVTVWQQFENAVLYQRHWSDNQVSITITFKDNEVNDLVEALQYFDDRIKAVSFLRLDNTFYTQAPYEEITKEEFDKRVSAISDVDFVNVSDAGQGVEFCTNDTCELSNNGQDENFIQEEEIL